MQTRLKRFTKKLRTFRKLITRNWKTSGAGCVSAAIALLTYYRFLTVEGGALWGALIFALGLLVSKDGDAPRVDNPKL